MLKVLLVDDETRDIELMKKSLDWESLGLQIVGTAYDGQTAIEKEVKLCPDIIITDLFMPLKNGMEFIAEVKKKHSNVHIIFVSGYEDFRCAQFGIENSIDSYILKPITPAKLKKAVVASANACIEAKKRKFEQENFQILLKENMPKLRHIFLNELITSPELSVNTIQRKLDFFKIAISDSRLCVVTLRSDEPFSPNDSISKNQLKQFEIGNAINEIIAQQPNICYFVRNDEEHVLILNCPDGDSMKWLGDLIHSIINNIKSIYGFSVTAGVGIVVDGYANLPVCYKTACTAVNYHFFTGKGQVIFYKDIVENQELSSYFINIPKNDIVYSVLTGNEAKLHSLIDTMFSQMSNEKLAPSIVRNLCIELVSCCINEINKVNESVIQKDSSSELIYKMLFSLTNIQDIVQHVTEFLMRLCSNFAKSVYDRHTEIVESICRIIDQRLNQSLSVEMIADEIFLSRGYATQIFKKVTGESINRYIINQRIEKAKELLRNTHLKINEVSLSVGYDNPTYFSSVFKNEVGISPREYRQRNIKYTSH